LETSANVSAQVTEIFNELPKGRLGFLQKVYFFNQKGFQMAISTNGTVIARLAGGLYNTVMSNATYLEVASLDPSTLANTLYSRDFAKSTDLAVATTLVTNLGLSSVAGLDNWVAAQLTAAGAENKGAKIVSLLNDFAGMSADATYGSFAIAFNTKVDAALAASQTTGAASSDFDEVGVVVVAGAEFELTTGWDRGADFVGTAQDDSFVAGDNDWTTGDTLDGGAGTDTFEVVEVGDLAIPTSATVVNIESADLIATGTVTADTRTWTGLTSLNVQATGTTALTAAATTDVTVTSTLTAANATVTNGDDVTVTASATTGKVTVTNPSGNVVVNYNGSFPNSADATLGASAGTAVTVTGGDTVTVVQKSGASAALLAATNYTVTQGAVTVTGNSSTTSVSVTQDAIVAANAGDGSSSLDAVGVAVGAVTITDVDATGVDKIATVTLNQFAASTITSSALTTLNLTGGTFSSRAGGAVTLDLQSTTTPATTLTINSTGYFGAISGTQADDYTTININSTGTTVAAGLQADLMTTLNFTGSGKTTITSMTTSENAALVDINVTGTGGVTLTAAIGAGTDFDGADGNDSVVLSASFTKGITMGAGNDTVTYAARTTGGSVAAGDGTDIIKMTDAEAATSAGSSAFNTYFTGFETLSISEELDGQTLDLDLINDVNTVILPAVSGSDGSYDGTNILSNFNNGGVLQILGDVADSSATLTITGVTTSLTVSMTGSDIDAGKIIANTATSVALNTADPTTVISANAGAIDLTATSATTLTVSGNNGVAITNNSGNTKITTFDASGVVSNAASATVDTSATADTVAELGVSFTSVNATATASVTITGGAGSDTLTGAAAMDTITGGAGNDTLSGAAGADVISGGAGNDTISGGAGVDTLTGGDGNDVFMFDASASDSTADGYDTITDLSTTDTIIVSGHTIVKTSTAVTGVSGKAAVSVLGVATFTHLTAESYDSLAEKVALVNAAVTTDDESALFAHDGNTFMFIQLNTGSEYDVVVQLTGVALPTSNSSYAAVTASSSTGLIGFGS
jgi:S-layer protein